MKKSSGGASSGTPSPARGAFGLALRAPLPLRTHSLCELFARCRYIGYRLRPKPIFQISVNTANSQPKNNSPEPRGIWVSNDDRREVNPTEQKYETDNSKQSQTKTNVQTNMKQDRPQTDSIDVEADKGSECNWKHCYTVSAP